MSLTGHTISKYDHESEQDPHSSKSLKSDSDSSSKTISDDRHSVPVPASSPAASPLTPSIFSDSQTNASMESAPQPNLDPVLETNDAKQDTENDNLDLINLSSLDSLINSTQDVASMVSSASASSQNSDDLSPPPSPSTSSLGAPYSSASSSSSSSVSYVASVPTYLFPYPSSASSTYAFTLSNSSSSASTSSFTASSWSNSSSPNVSTTSLSSSSFPSSSAAASSSSAAASSSSAATSSWSSSHLNKGLHHAKQRSASCVWEHHVQNKERTGPLWKASPSPKASFGFIPSPISSSNFPPVVLPSSSSSTVSGIEVSADPREALEHQLEALNIIIKQHNLPETSNDASSLTKHARDETEAKHDNNVEVEYRESFTVPASPTSSSPSQTSSTKESKEARVAPLTSFPSSLSSFGSLPSSVSSTSFSSTISLSTSSSSSATVKDEKSDKDHKAIIVSPRPSKQETEEDELLHQLRREYFRTHPQLRFKQMEKPLDKLEENIRLRKIYSGEQDDEDYSPYSLLSTPSSTRSILEASKLSTPRIRRFASYTHSFFDKWDTSFPPIEEHGMIGNMHTVALVCTDAKIDWYCYPHFDSPSLFGSLVDKDRGGFFAIRAGSLDQQGVSHKQLYHPETNILITRFLSEDGVGQVQDFMVVGARSYGHGWLIRELEVVRGKMYFEVECHPAFNYGRDTHDLTIVSHGARFKSGKLNMVLTSTRTHEWRSTKKGSAVTTFQMVEGQKEVFIFRESFSGKMNNPFAAEKKEDQTGHPASMSYTDTLRLSTMRYWRQWLNRCTYTGRWRETIFRSALALKLLIFEPTGAIVAAPTTSVPETIGGVRNWDYRFTWIRDSSFVLYAFLRLGFKEEAKAFMAWVQKRCEELNKDGTLQIMYGIRGEHKLNEEILKHLGGYRNSRPVRIGNDAYHQFQLDIYGELMDTVYLSNKYAEPISYDFWTHIRKLVDWVCKHWIEADEGIWEMRVQRQHYTYSKVMAWVAVDRALRLAESRSFPADISSWRKVRNEIYTTIMDRCWSETRQAFVQSYDSDVLDASVLVMPFVFFISPTDPRFVKTLEAILTSVNDGGLVSNNLVFRYNLETTKDGLTGEEGTFSICTFWAVEAMTRLGAYKPEYLERARLMFEQTLGYANHVGLFSEEIGRRGEHLGNFPQAFTHLALISAAFNLDRALGSSGSRRRVISSTDNYDNIGGDY